jgi:TP901 family phage tail tape measure protein
VTDRSVVYRLRAEVSQFRAQMAQASASTQKVAHDLTALDKNGANMRRGLSTFGSTAGKVGLVAAAGLGVAIAAAANFDQSMSNVQAATHETAENMELLRAAALKAGADTAFSATEAAAGVEELAKAGVSTADILGGGLTGALDLAAAGGLEVAQAAEISATALTQFKLAGEDVGHVADLLAAGAGKAQGSVEDMGMALKQSGLVAAQTGLTVEETTGTLAAFASAGLIGSDAGTSFKTMLQSLTPTSNKARNLMDDLGITAYDAAGNFVGMTEFAGNLQAGLADLSVEQQNAAMKTIFGSDAVRAASVVFQQGAGGADRRWRRLAGAAAVAGAEPHRRGQCLQRPVARRAVGDDGSSRYHGDHWRRPVVRRQGHWWYRLHQGRPAAARRHCWADQGRPLRHR